MFQGATDLMVAAITDYPRELSMIGSLYGESALQNQHGMILQVQVDPYMKEYRWILIATDRKVTAHAVHVSEDDMRTRIEQFAEGV